MDPIRGVEVRTPCGHYYDMTCILALFETAMKDEYLFPPRCCARKIPVSSKKKGYGTRNRVYCSRPSCSRFLGTQHKGSFPFVFRRRKFECPAPDCRTPADVDVSLLSLGQHSGWARCPCCETMIELNDGCYHITCRCGAEFCYRCQARWRICIC
ncbi:hypothetical protein K466DRAFT_645879 [Polyporus arcularius HHB13444]|uniref:IBR domain-containing protein n=1 Tax=Polyporus arcularius HHB13444 TaxID=1314778 RepID=A0A5C3PE26_9APHY|nr:hypothetical protein K466DRAFT_645879 [Polyporus arcularius HHB13444]